MLKIHGVPFSVHTRKVILTALEKQIPYAFELTFPFDPPADWKQLSPTGKIPAITDGDFSLADSGAICAYLEKRYPQHPLYPTAAEDYGRVLWLENYLGGGFFREAFHPLFAERVFKPKLYGQEPSQAEIERILNEVLPEKLAYLNSWITGEYLVGKAFTLADITLVSNLLTYHYLGYGIGSDYPALRAYFARMLERPSIRQVRDAERPVVQGAEMGLITDFEP